MKYFRYLPQTEYSSKKLVNTNVRAKLRQMVVDNVLVYYPYFVKEHDRPDTIAHQYYGSSDYTWMVLYANDMIHPIYDFPMSGNVFNKYVIGKYGDLYTPQQEIHHYLNAKGLVIDETSYLELPDNERSAVTIYEHENNINEAKRNIKLIDNEYTLILVNELRQLFK